MTPYPYAPKAHPRGATLRGAPKRRRRTCAERPLSIAAAGGARYALPRGAARARSAHPRGAANVRRAAPNGARSALLRAAPRRRRRAARSARFRRIFMSPFQVAVRHLEISVLSIAFSEPSSEFIHQPERVPPPQFADDASCRCQSSAHRRRCRTPRPTWDCRCGRTSRRTRPPRQRGCSPACSR